MQCLSQGEPETDSQQLSQDNALDPLQAPQLEVKVFAREPLQIALPELVPIFHEWIQHNRLPDELAIDVANYAHLHEGPGVMLVCHGAHYRFEGGRRPGLRYSRKRGGPSIGSSQRLLAAFKVAFGAARLLEQQQPFRGRLQFRSDVLLLRIVNRLLAPAGPETFSAVHDPILAVCAQIYGAGARVHLEPEGGPSEPFGVRITASDAPPLAQL